MTLRAPAVCYLSPGLLAALALISAIWIQKQQSPHVARQYAESIDEECRARRLIERLLAAERDTHAALLAKDSPRQA